MKRLWIAAAMFGMVISLCVVTLMYQNFQINVLLEELDNLEQCAKSKSAADALPMAEAFLDEYERRTKLFPCFMSHSDLSGCQETVATLPAILSTNHTEEFFQEISRCRAQLIRLRNVETPILQNIF